MSSKFSQQGGVQPTPKICKEVGDSLRFVPTPMKSVMQWSTDGTLGGTVGDWHVNGAGLLHQVGNPIFQWNGTIGPISGDNALVHLFYDDIARILTIHYFAKETVNIIFQKVKILLNIDRNQPLGTDYLLFTDDGDGGTIQAQFLF